MSLLVALIIVLIGLKSIKNSDTFSGNIDNNLIISNSKLLDKHLKSVVLEFKKNKSLGSKYSHPIYFYLSDNPDNEVSIIKQMGYIAYEANSGVSSSTLPIKFWLSEHSILISISMGSNSNYEYVNTLCCSLNKWRPRQALNGILLATDVKELLNNIESTNQKADQIQLQIKKFNNTFGLNLPIYNIITQMGQLSDFCQFFSSIDEASRHEVFGATSPIQKGGGIDDNWFNKQYDNLISQLMSNMTTALTSQLNQDYRNAICSAPYQLGLLKQGLSKFLHRLYKSDQTQDRLNFRGFYFTNGGREKPQIDVLASLINQNLGYEKFQQKEQIPLQQTLFVQQLMTHVILNERDLVGVNRRKERMLLLGQVIYALTWLGLLISTLIIIKLDFDYQSHKELLAAQMLDDYKGAIASNPYNIENMSDNIPNLYSLSRIYSLYEEPSPWYSLSFISSSSIKKEVERAYFSELQKVLITSMKQLLERDLLIHINLQDHTSTLSMLNHYRLLFKKERTDIMIAKLKAYFSNTFHEQGENDDLMLKRLDLLLNDALYNKMTPDSYNESLEKSATKLINQNEITNILYEYILSKGRFLERADIRDELGKNFGDLFSFSPNYAGYMVPYAYTPSGFNDLDLSGDSPLVIEALEAYEGITDSSPSESELNRINLSLRNRYLTEYITHWRGFSENITVNSFSNIKEIQQALLSLSKESDNPLTALYSAITNYTLVYDPDSDLSKLDNYKLEAARQIESAFNEYHKKVDIDSKGSKPIDVIIDNYNNLSNWLANIYKANSPEKESYELLIKESDKNNPVELLSSQADSQTKFSREVMKLISSTTNELLIEEGHKYLNYIWNKDIYTAYIDKLAAYYPFSPHSKTDASVEIVNNFFRERGTLDRFYQDNINKLALDDNYIMLPGLIPNSGKKLDSGILNVFNHAKDIQASLYVMTPQNMTVPFSLQVKGMSKNIVRFAIESDKTIYTYQHGPRLWVDQSWEAANAYRRPLIFQLEDINGSRTQKIYEGSWAWFRAFENAVTPADSQYTNVKFTIKNNSVDLMIKTQGGGTPFSSHLFSSFRLPSQL